MRSKSKIWITGSSGMLGKKLSKILKKQGHQIIEGNKKIFDQTSQEKVIDYIKENQPDEIILTSALVGGIEYNSKNSADFLYVNSMIALNIINAASILDIKKLTFLGSSCMYPKDAIQPIKEDSLLTGKFESTNEWYATAKIAGLKLCEALRKQYGFDAITLMPTNLYGLGDNFHPTNSHVMGALIRRFSEAVQQGKESIVCWGTGKPLREFLYSDDFGDACVFALENWDPFADDAPKDENNDSLFHLNVGSGNEISIKNLANMISETTGYSGDIIWDSSKPDGTFRKQLDSSRLLNLGWSPKVSFKEGLKLATNFFKQIEN